MKNSYLLRIAAVGAALALPAGAMAQSAPAGAMAQSAPAGATSQSPPSQKPGMGHSEASMLKNMSQNVDAHIAELHGQLKITPAEETQWAEFAQVMRNNASAMEAAFSQRGAALQTMNAVQDLQSYAQVAQVQSNNMDKLAAAFQTLYSGFPPAQQKLADGVFRAQKIRH